MGDETARIEAEKNRNSVTYRKMKNITQTMLTRAAEALQCSFTNKRGGGWFWSVVGAMRVSKNPGFAILRDTKDAKIQEFFGRADSAARERERESESDCAVVWAVAES